MYLTPETAVLVVLGLVAVNVCVGFLLCAYQTPSWIRRRRARRIEEAFASESFTVPKAWVREARRHPSAARR